MTPVINKALPEFEALPPRREVHAQSHLGHAVVLYFYPKDNTPGCTTEAMQFRDRTRISSRPGALILGVSRDNMTVARKVQDQPRAAVRVDRRHRRKACHMFGVVKNKIMYGKKVKGIERSTFLIDGTGVLPASGAASWSPATSTRVLKARPSC
jgi:peroxiredoxin Q/BCP